MRLCALLCLLAVVEARQAVHKMTHHTSQHTKAVRSHTLSAEDLEQVGANDVHSLEASRPGLDKLSDDVDVALSELINLQDRFERVRGEMLQIEDDVRAYRGDAPKHLKAVTDKETVIKGVDLVKSEKKSESHKVEAIEDKEEAALSSSDAEEILVKAKAPVEAEEQPKEAQEDMETDLDSRSQGWFSMLQVPTDSMNDNEGDDEMGVVNRMMPRMMGHRQAALVAQDTTVTPKAQTPGEVVTVGVRIPETPEEGVPAVIKSDVAPPAASTPDIYRFKVDGDAVPDQVEEEPTHMCVCKRQGAPRGADRIRCRRNATPTPTPTPKPDNIIQCARGKWQQGQYQGQNDTICIYFPGVTPTVPSDPVIVVDPELPPECYDDRNEFVAEGVNKKPYDLLLLQQGYEACSCSE